jgi:predicted Zn finger-like uncharacterized protein
MRLTCPNCGARYEVDDAMIPPEGRDVQCSDCATTWFQPGRAAEPEAGPDPAPAPEAPVDAAADVSDPEPEGEAWLEPEPQPEPAPDPEPEVEIPAHAENATRVVPANDLPEEDDPEHARPSDGDAAVTPDDAQGGPGRRAIDPAIRDILREEAEREARLRRAEADPVETQAEMPLDEEPQDTHRARRRAEFENAEDAFAPAAAAQAGASRRDLLPDIEEINSTLRPASDAQAELDEMEDEDAHRAGRRRRGVRIGFLVTLAVAAALFYVYANADDLAARAPQAAPAIDAFRAQVDDARLWLDGVAQDLVDADASGPE